jgi:two-component system, NarL family, sensor histidine kinase DevS
MSVETRGVRDWVITLTRELSTTLGFDVKVSFVGPIDAGISDAIAEHLLATVREAVTNIGRHARATAAWVTLSVEDRMCTLTVEDNGTGIKDAAPSAWNLGLQNLKSRAEQLHGSFSIESPASGGAILTWQVPVGS